MTYIIVDLEATCWEQRDGRLNEIIEIGALCVDEQQRTLGEFDAFVRPTQHPQLSDFCTQLTTITQSQVDAADSFPAVLPRFLDWVRSFGDDYLLCSWGHYDRVQFMNDCAAHGLAHDWAQRHVSLKHEYGRLKGMRRPPGMKRALRQEGLSLEGTHHRGIDDVRNIAKIFRKYFDEWVFRAA